jgi:hypothetical protein
MTSTDDEEMQATYGPAAPFSEHRRGERIRYQIDRYTYTGEILWVCAAGEVAGRHLPLRYIVAPDVDTGFIDVVFPSDVTQPDTPI